MDKLDVQALAQSMIAEIRALVERLKTSFNNRIAEIESKHAARISAIPAGPKGDKGENGVDGKDGAPGADADPSHVKQLVEAAVSALPKPKDGAPGVDGKDGASVKGERGDPGKDADPALLLKMVREAVAAMPTPKDGESVTVEDVAPLIAAEVGKAVAALPKPANGRDADPELIARMVREAVTAGVAAIPKAVDGKSLTLHDVAPMIVKEVASALDAALEAIPAPKDGAPGRDGKDADPELVARLVDQAVAALPKPKDGLDGKAGKDGENGEKGDAGQRGEPGKDGKDVDQIALRSMVGDEVKNAVAALPRAQDGKNGADGRDAAELDILPSIDESKSYRRGTWASHNGGLIRSSRQTDPVNTGSIVDAGWVVMVEGFPVVVFTQGDDPREITCAAVMTSGTKIASTFRVPVMIYREIWREGEYERGDVVTWGGSAWHCQQKTTDKPGTSPAWRLMVKEGARGKDAGGPAAAISREPVRIK